MSYNLKNKAVVVIALAFAFTLTLNHVSFAAEENAAAATGKTIAVELPTEALIQPAESAAAKAADVADKVADAADEVTNAADEAADAVNKVADAVDNVAKDARADVAALQQVAAETDINVETPQVKQLPFADAEKKEEASSPDKSNDEGLDFLNEQKPDDFLNNNEMLIDAADMSAQFEPIEGTAPTAGVAPAGEAAPTASEQPADAVATDNPLDDAALNEGFDELKELEPVLPDAEAPKSPLEKFGNAILSKVDNNLFNQMSHIEKEATLLQLEKKREELRTKVLEERQKSLAIIEATRRAKMQLEEERLKAEAERKAKILEEERKLKEKEMELEKLRQAKVINDYMNEMLMMNQQWVEKSAKLQGRIKELEDERVDLIETFKTKITDIDEEILKTKEHAVLAVQEHEKVVAEFESKIEDLQGTINDLNLELSISRKKMKELQEAAANPFNEEDKEDGPNKNDKDMAQEYAIMDITGKGDDIVAKIINTDGKVFIVHKGSMLKNGEVVTAITDHYISFENKGVKSYLYTGNTIVEYEPEASFSGTSDMLSNAVSEDDDDLQSGVNAAVELNEKAAAKARAKDKAIRDKAKQTAPKKSDSVSKAPAKKAKNQSLEGSSSPSSPHVSAPSFGRGMFVR